MLSLQHQLKHKTCSLLQQFEISHVDLGFVRHNLIKSVFKHYFTNTTKHKEV